MLFKRRQYLYLALFTFVLFVLVSTARTVVGAEIELKSGQKLRGEIVKETEHEIVLKVFVGISMERTIKRSDIKAIHGNEPSATSTSTTSASPPPAAAPAAKSLAGPALKAQLLCLTYIGGAQDDFINEVGFEAGNPFANGNGFKFIFNPKSLKGIVSGTPAGAKADPKGSALPGYKLDLKARSVKVSETGETLTIQYKQVNGILQQPFLTSTAGWKFWGWSRAEAEPHKLMADSRGYDIWLMPDGRHVGVMCWCDGGNSTLDRHPQDLTKGVGEVFANSFSKTVGGMSTMIMKIDVKERKPVSGTFMASHVFLHASDAHGRFYAARQMGRRWAASNVTDPFQMGESVKSGLFVLDNDLKTNILHIKVGGEEAEKQAFGPLAIEGNLLIMGGYTDAKKMKAVNAVQDKNGGGVDAMVAVLKLWD